MIDATLDIDLGQLLAFELDILTELLALSGKIGMFRVGLRADRNVLTGCHRHRTSDEPGDTGNENIAGFGRRRCDADD